MSASDHHSVRRVVLPSGKTIEVVYFDDLLGAPVRSSATKDRATTGLHVCPRCESETVFPLEWQEAGFEHWEMTLRCPNCEWIGGGIFEQELVERLEEILDDGTETLVCDLKRLTQANMEEEIDRFSAALIDGHILPMDF
jgi:hypothetical protein